MNEEPKKVQVIESSLEKQRIYCVASGEIDGVLKFYMYAKTEVGAEFFVELEITRVLRQLHANIKTNRKEERETFKKVLESIIRKELK